VWQKGDGSRTVYHHGAGAHAQPTPAQADNLLLNLDDIWQLEPSAKEFSSLIAGIEESKVEERPAGYVISSGKERAVGSSRLIKATLTLSRTDLPCDRSQTVLVDTHMVRSTRVPVRRGSFERLPQKSVAPASLYAPKPELMGKDRGVVWATEGRGESQRRFPSRPSSTDSSAVRSASAELEVDVAYLLNQAKADRSEQVTLTAHVDWFVAGRRCRRQRTAQTRVAKRISAVSNNPGCENRDLYDY